MPVKQDEEDDRSQTLNQITFRADIQQKKIMRERKGASEMDKGSLFDIAGHKFAFKSVNKAS